MKRIIAVFVTVLLLAGCSTSPAATSSAANSEASYSSTSISSSLQASSSSAAPNPVSSAAAPSSSSRYVPSDPYNPYVPHEMPVEPLRSVEASDWELLEGAWQHYFEIGAAPYYKDESWIVQFKFTGEHGIDIFMGPFTAGEAGRWFLGSYSIDGDVIIAQVERADFGAAENEPIFTLTFRMKWNPEDNDKLASITLDPPTSATQFFDEWFSPIYGLELPYIFPFGRR